LVQTETAKQQEAPQLPDEAPKNFDPAVRSSVLAYLTTDNQPYVDDLLAFAAIPSISALPDHASDVLAAAGWLKQRMMTAGLENVQVLPTKGAQPVVSVIAMAVETDTHVARVRQETVKRVSASAFWLRVLCLFCRCTVTGCMLVQTSPLCLYTGTMTCSQ
jgi:hypothetical protein